LFAIKTIFTEKESDMKDTLREVRFLRVNRHPCIIDVHDGFMTSQPRLLFIVMPYCEGGDLDGLIKLTKKAKTSINEDKIIKWSIQIALAMHFLHENSVIHRDLKPNNVMLTEGGDLIKVVDFGLAMSTKEVLEYSHLLTLNHTLLSHPFTSYLISYFLFWFLIRIQRTTLISLFTYIL
jgi:serine/threonine protein kinase